MWRTRLLLPEEEFRKLRKKEKDEYERRHGRNNFLEPPPGDHGPVLTTRSVRKFKPKEEFSECPWKEQEAPANWPPAIQMAPSPKTRARPSSSLETASARPSKAPKSDIHMLMSAVGGAELRDQSAEAVEGPSQNAPTLRRRSRPSRAPGLDDTLGVGRLLAISLGTRQQIWEEATKQSLRRSRTGRILRCSIPTGQRLEAASLPLTVRPPCRRRTLPEKSRMPRCRSPR